jgi:hypothetical protein
MIRRRTTLGIALLLTLILCFNVVVMGPSVGKAEAWYDGNKLSEAYPNYGIHDMVSNMSLILLQDRFPEKATYITYWFIQAGADSVVPSFENGRTIPGPNDNFLAYTDDAPQGDAESYFLHNGKGWPTDIDAAIEIQRLANCTIENLTAWMLQGMPNGTWNHHRAVYNLGILSHYMADMGQFGHTDYSKYDQSKHPIYDPYATSYQDYYERYIWEDSQMNYLINDFENRDFNVPPIPDASDLHRITADVARYTNTRGQPSVQMTDSDAKVITVGPIYKQMLETFRANWEGAIENNGARGMDPVLWNLTVENLMAATENLTTFYISIWDKAWDNFLRLSADLSVVSYSYVPQNVIAGDNVKVTATIKNNGPRDSGTFACSVFAKGAIIPGDPLEDRFLNLQPLNLPPNSEGNVTFAPFIANNTQLNVTIRADYLEDVYESNEDDNTMNFTITPIPETHGSSMSLDKPFTQIRQDTEKAITVRIQNSGNRMDVFNLSAVTTTTGIVLTPQLTPIIVMPFSSATGWVKVRTMPSTPLGSGEIGIQANGVNSTCDIDVQFSILKRTNDPVPVITGESWTRIGENFTLSAAMSYDPDGDPLSFYWELPDYGRRDGAEVAFNYSVAGEYEIKLFIFDGNVTLQYKHIVTVYPKVPQNLSATVAGIGVTSVIVRWTQWGAGGLIDYWLEAKALPDQGERSQRGPYYARFGPGNNTGSVGAFLPGTDVVVDLWVNADRFGNKTVNTLLSTTGDIGPFDAASSLGIQSGYLYVKYKPWLEKAAIRDPSVLVERMYKKEWIPIGSPRENMSRTANLDILRYQLGSSFGDYRATFTYFLSDGVVPFTISNSTSVANKAPIVSLIGAAGIKEMDMNGTARLYMQFDVDDLEDSVTLDVDWGDGSSDNGQGPFGDGSSSLFHNYTETGTYTIRIIATDYVGDLCYVNATLAIVPFSLNITDEKDPNLILKIVLSVIGGILLIGILAFFGYTGYKFAKKESEIEFDMDKMKGRMDHKPGTGTDFDKRRDLQIPKESIMKVDAPDAKDEAPAAKEPSIVSGSIVFDEE